MTQPGGSATINGILYQLLGVIHQAANIRLSATQDGDEVLDAKLIIEPSGGGGDVRIHFPNRQLVEQWKAKSDHGTWSLQQVITSVLPDLYLAVGDDYLDDRSEYWFVTEGRRGVWAEAQSFFRSLDHRSIPVDPLSVLDGTEKISFFPGRTCTQRELFLEIVEKVRQRESVRSESEYLTHRKVWRLLARFDIKEQLTEEELRKQIDFHLKGAVDYREDVDAKRQELCGLLLDLVAQGEVNIVPGELFRRVGLSETAVQNWSALKSNLSDELDRQLQRQKYDRDKDVRTAPEWPIHFPILLLSGESGQGKTWQLFNLARQASENEGLGVLVIGQSNAGSILQNAADVVWQTGLDHDQTLSLGRIVHRIWKLIPTVPNPWLTVCVDDVQSPVEARRLIEQDWESWGIRLAMTTPPISDRPTETPPGPYEQLLATRALAALHEDEAVINSVLRWGLHTPADLTEWREGCPLVSDERLQTAITTLGSEESTARTNAVLVIGMSGQRDLAPHIRQVLSDAPTGSELARAAVVALGDLANTDLETVRLLKEQLEVPEQRIPALNALLRIGTQESLDALEHYLLKIGPNVLSFQDVSLRVIAALGQDLTRRQHMSNLLWTTMKGLPLTLWPNECIEMVGDVDDSTAQEWLREQAFPPEGSLPDASRLVFIIRGLAKFDPEAALQAAQFALQRIQGRKEGIPRLLLDLDLARGISVLCNHIPQERHTLMRWAIGRALRYVEKVDLVRQHIEEMLKSPDSEVRRAGAELCGWQDDDYLHDVLHSLYTADMSEKVRGAAREALLRQRDQKETRQLFDMFRAASNVERWRVLEAIIELGDPYLLGHKEDPLWLAQILDNAEIALVKHAEKRLEERVKEMQERAKQIDREIERAG